MRKNWPILLLVVVLGIGIAGCVLLYRAGHRDIHQAAARGDLKRMKAWMSIGVRPTALDDEGRAPLHNATMARRRHVIDFLVSRGVDVDITTDQGTTALMMAARSGHLPIMQQLLDLGADPNLGDEFEGTALSWAAHNANHLAVTRLLIEHGANVKAVMYTDMQTQGGRLVGDPTTATTPLYESVLWGERTEVTDLLIEAGANYTIHVAARVGDV